MAITTPPHLIKRDLSTIVFVATNMKKLIGVLSVLSMLVFATPALAASVSGAGTAIFSGQTNLYGNAGDNKQMSTNYDIPVGQVLHAIQTDFIGDNLPPVCHVTGVYEGAQTNIPVSFSETLSPNAGDYGYTETAFVAATVDQANALNQNQGTACTGSSATVYNQSNVVHVLPTGTGANSGSNTPVPAWQAAIDAMAAQIKALGDLVKTALTGTQNSGGTTVSAACANFNKKAAGTMPNMTNAQNGVFQGFLIGEGASIPALTNNQAPYGFYGPQTMQAVTWYKQVNSCN